jgi:hypothetical protein
MRSQEQNTQVSPDADEEDEQSDVAIEEDAEGDFVPAQR